MKTRQYTIKGIRPILMHSEQLSDPLNKWSKALREISKKRQKTDDDLLEMSRREWFGGLYWDSQLGVHIPERCLERMIRDAASLSKRGKDINRGLIVADPAPLEYKGPKNPDDLWVSGEYLLRSSVGVTGKRVIRSRPMFRDWQITFQVEYDEQVLDAADIDQFVETAGRLIGVGDWRPKYGRFQVVEVSA